MGIGFVVALYASIYKVPGGRFVLVGADPQVRQVLDLMRLSTVIPLAEDVDSGLVVLCSPELVTYFRSMAAQPCR